MSNEQRSTLSFWTGIFLKVMLGFSGALLLLMYYDFREDQALIQKQFIDYSIDVKTDLNNIRGNMEIVKERLIRVETKLEVEERKNDH